MGVVIVIVLNNTELRYVNRNDTCNYLCLKREVKKGIPFFF